MELPRALQYISAILTQSIFVNVSERYGDVTPNDLKALNRRLSKVRVSKPYTPYVISLNDRIAPRLQHTYAIRKEEAFI